MSITILERIQKFYNFELTLNSKQLEFWDIFRRELFLRYCYEYDLRKLQIHYKGREKRKYLLKSFLSLFLIHRLKEKKLIYVSSRYKKNDCYYDPNIYDIYLTDKESFRIIETSNFINKLVYRSNNENYFKVFKKFIKVEKIPEVVYQIAIKIEKELKCGVDFSFYNYLYQDFRRELKIYFKLYSFIKPKAIFFVNTDNHKGRILAAKKLGIKIIEIQHGDIGFQSCPYYFDSRLDSNSLISPTGILVQSEFWKNNIRFNGFVENVGNSYYYREKKLIDKQYDVTIYTNVFNLEIFRNVIKELLECGYSGKICIKLHPDQYDDFSEIESEYKNLKNVVVIFREIDGITLLEKSKQILLMHSSIAYQAVNIGVKTLVWVDNNNEYQLYGNLLEEKAICLIHNTNELLEQLSKKELELYDLNNIYENFNLEKYKKIEEEYLGKKL